MMSNSRTKLKKKSSNALLLAARAAFGGASSAIASGINYVADTADWVLTWFRSWQVFSAVWENHLNTQNASFVEKLLKAEASDADSPNTHFNKNVYHEDGSLSHIGKASAGVMGLAFLIGIGRAIYKHYHELRLKSYDYLRNRTKKVDKTLREQSLSESQWRIKMKTHQDALLRKIAPDASDSSQYEVVDGIAYVQVKRKVAYGAFFSPASKPTATLAKPSVADRVSGIINEAGDSNIGKLASYLWNWLQNHAFIFWITWMPFALAVGLAGVATAMPAIIAVTFAVGAAFTLWKAGSMVYSWLKDRADVRNITKILENNFNIDASLSRSKQSEKLQFQDDINSIISYLQKNDEKYQLLERFKLTKHNAGIKADYILSKYRDAQVMDAAKQEQVSKKLIQRSFMKYEQAAVMKKLGVNLLTQKISIDNAHLSVPSLQQVNKLKNRLMSSKARTVLLIIAAATIAFIMPMFFFWLAGSIALAAGTVFAGAAIFGAVATFCGSAAGAAMATYVGVGLAAFFGVTSWAGLHAGSKSHDAKVNASLDASYKGSNLTKAQKYLQEEAELYRRVNALKGDGTAQASLRAAGYDFKHFDPENDYYHEKQKYSPNKKTLLKKFLNRVYAAIGGGQSGMMLDRALFLTGGGVLAFSLTLLPIAAPIAFIGIAVGAFVLLGGMALARYELNAKHKHKEHFVDNIDERISSLRKKNKILARVLNENVPQSRPQENGRGAQLSSKSSPSLRSPREKDNSRTFNRRGNMRVTQFADAPRPDDSAMPLLLDDNDNSGLGAKHKKD